MAEVTEPVPRIRALDHPAVGPPWGGSFHELDPEIETMTAGVEMIIELSCSFCRAPLHPGPCAGPKSETPKKAAPKKGGAPAPSAEGSSTAEKANADKLNRGEKLSRSSSKPEEAELQATIDDWAEGGAKYTKLHSEMRAATGDPTAQTRGAKLMRTIASSDASSPTLHRGLYNVDPADIPTMGSTFKIGASSFSRDKKVADTFAGKTKNGGHAVRIKVRPGSRSLRIDRAVGPDYAHEAEHITMGSFRVVSAKTRTNKYGHIVHDIEVEQIEV